MGVVEGIEGKWHPITSVKIHPDHPIFECYEKEGESRIIFFNSNNDIEMCWSRKERGSKIIYKHPSLRPLAPFIIKITLKEKNLLIFLT